MIQFLEKFKSGIAAIAHFVADERGYIDPGTGSMLFTILIGLISAGVYGLRNAIVKARFLMSGGRQEKGADETLLIAMFSDSKRYWNVFEPICDELESRGVSASYLTASPDDPALEKPYEHVSCEFIGEGNKAFARLNMLKADIVLSSTPGLDVYQWKRSRDVKWYAHVLHAVSDATMYRMFGLDFYDAVLLTGSYQADQLRELERLRNLPAKELVVVGQPYMDAMAKRLERAEAGMAEGDAAADPSAPTVLLAPSWGASAILSLYGGEMIGRLLDAGFRVIIRPHPQSFTSEADLIEQLQREYPESDRLEWNRDNDNFEVLSRADVMVSDFSGVIFDFALIFDKPVVYTEPRYDKAPYDACWIDEELWTFEVLPKIGVRLDDESLADIGAVIERCLSDESLQTGRDEARGACWAHRGESAKLVADYLLATQKRLREGESSSQSS